MTQEEFVVEEADDFGQEVESLGKSERFQQFLSERAAEPATTTLEEYRHALD